MQADIYDSIRPAQKIKSLKEFCLYSGISFRDFLCLLLVMLGHRYLTPMSPFILEFKVFDPYDESTLKETV